MNKEFCIPSTESYYVIKFCSVLATNSKPVYVQVYPEQYAIDNYCFDNIYQKVQRDGGTPVYGWSIIEYEHLYLEAQFHCILLSKENNLVDITPHEYGLNRILFLEQVPPSYTGASVPNKHYPLNDPEKVEELIALQKKLKGKMNILIANETPKGDPKFKALKPLIMQINNLKNIMRRL